MKTKMGSKSAEVVVIGSLKEFVRNERYFKYSSVGMEYSHLTEHGKEELAKIIELNLALLRDSMEIDAEERAKEIMMQNLKS